MSVASLWAGIEGLFVINLELRFRLAALIATMLEPQSEARLTLYRRLKVLYDFRSKAVHGGEASEDQLLDHVAEMRFIASRLLTKVIEGKEVPSSEALEAALFAERHR